MSPAYTNLLTSSLPPQFTRAHHIHWWERDTGPTDLANGVLLCESCHHRIHDNGWDIHIDPPGGREPGERVLESGAPPGTGVGATSRVWFIPPAHIDPHRTPRLGGLARYTLAA